MMKELAEDLGQEPIVHKAPGQPSRDHFIKAQRLIEIGHSSRDGNRLVLF
jgi:hypothetical protein